MQYQLIRSSRKTLALSIEPDGTILVRAPLRLPMREIEHFVLSHQKWIDTHRERVLRRTDFDAAHYATAEQIAALRATAEQILPQKTAYWAKLMGVTPRSVKITAAQKRFGSCSSQNGICYSYRLMAYPEEAIDYVVVHELAHIRHKNHSRDFYAFVKQFLPDWQQREMLLRHVTEKNKEDNP